MPTIKEYHEIDITLEKFLRACSDTELYEITLLLARRDYAERIARVGAVRSLTKTLKLKHK